MCHAIRKPWKALAHTRQLAWLFARRQKKGVALIRFDLTCYVYLCRQKLDVACGSRGAGEKLASRRAGGNISIDQKQTACRYFRVWNLERAVSKPNKPACRQVVFALPHGC